MKIFKYILGALLCVAILFTAFIGRFEIVKSHSFNTNEGYKGVLTLWHIDGFEGGIGSRKQFLLKIARGFEKSNQGVLIMVIEHTPDSIKDALKNGDSPDMISFSQGVEIKGISELNFSTQINGGKVGEKTYAVPWCRGGYTLIANPKLATEFSDRIEELLVSQSQFSQPLCALLKEGICADNIVVKKPMDAYVQFVAGKTPYFLATQRDIIRLERRGIEVQTKPLTKYNDLYQYISVTATDSQRSYFSNKFIEYLISSTVQKKITEIGMLSCTEKLEYQNEHLYKMQDVNNISTISVFTHSEKLVELQENSLQALRGNKELEIKIKNMLI